MTDHTGAQGLEFLYRNKGTAEEKWIPYLTSKWDYDWDMWRLVYSDGQTAPKFKNYESHLSWVGSKTATWRRASER